ncbi:SDR family oxidoreductase [Hyphococcus luteus]|uniref:3-oxoacyl-ACP reductase n=1 Tax=Hyphococcus luteus TaxID=2058213 RepID=A0A2S7K287_9PROT|nr:SDR family oxidoreductase [Marinicaulis flavus]PQA86617.1 3-oxoacyl-ACP reductase [Marinicaulis flavus]
MTDPLFSIDGKIALVTGGTSGIGLMIARGLTRRGVKTYITGRDEKATAELAETLSAEENGGCIGLGADLAGEDGPRHLAEALAERETALHILINNAGAGEAAPLPDVSVADWDMVMNVNLRAPFFLVQKLLPLLEKAASASDPARVINLGSIGGLHIPNWDAFPYGASKAAIHHLTRALTKRLGSSRITVNAIAPGPFPSRLTDTSLDAVKKSIETYVPLGRPGEPEDVEGLVVFLASRAGAYVNGSTIPLDGGYIAAL